MSLQDSIRSARKMAVENMIWVRMILNQKKTEWGREVTKLPNLYTPGEARDRAVRHIIRHYLMYAFGNLAVRQARNAAEFPNVNFNLPYVTYRINGMRNQAELSLNMNSFVRCLWELSVVHGATIVQLAEPFADLAIRYLKSTGEETRLFRQFPHDLWPAKHLAFDFVSGVDFDTLNAQEKMVIQILNTRILRIQGPNPPMVCPNRQMMAQPKQMIVPWHHSTMVQAKPMNVVNFLRMVQAKPEILPNRSIKANDGKSSKDGSCKAHDGRYGSCKAHDGESSNDGKSSRYGSSIASSSNDCSSKASSSNDCSSKANDGKSSKYYGSSKASDGKSQMTAKAKPRSNH